MVSIFLIGFMGSSKSSVGGALAERLDRPFIDLDERLVARFGAPIPQVFAEDGEAAFRRSETQELARAAAVENVVVATGGGSFCSSENREIILSSGGVPVFLDLPWEVLSERLSHDSDQRPLFVDNLQARRLFDARLPYYRMASVVVGLDGRESVAEVVERVVESVQEQPCAI